MQNYSPALLYKSKQRCLTHRSTGRYTAVGVTGRHFILAFHPTIRSAPVSFTLARTNTHMSKSDTEIKLKLWRGDQVRAERLVAALLHIEGFTSVDPQCPLGGPDGLKDVLCEKNGWKYVAAAYFPTTDQTLGAVERKFKHDLDGVKSNSANGIVFITNQQLSPAEREGLIDEAASKGHAAIVYHLERVRAVLDSPSGYGIRLEYLDVEMQREEQLSFFALWDRSFTGRLREHGQMIVGEISKKIDSLMSRDNQLGLQLTDIASTAQRTVSELGALLDRSNKALSPPPVAGHPTRQLTIESLCMLHSALMFESVPGVQVGKLRTLTIWIAGAGTSIQDAAYVPPPPEQVSPMLDDLLSRWRESSATVEDRTIAERLDELTRFHHEFLKIHPFIDGNGRMARFLLAQQAKELLGIERRVIIEDRNPYFDALQKADAGSYEALKAAITQAIYGVEFIAGTRAATAGDPCIACNNGIIEATKDAMAVQCSYCGATYVAHASAG